MGLYSRTLSCLCRKRIGFAVKSTNSCSRKESALVKYSDGSDLLRALCNAVVSDIGQGVKAIDIQSKLLEPFECSVGTHTLFERWWYEDLLKSINNCLRDKVILIGSSGTSTSTWQFWYLYRVLQATHKGKLQFSIEYVILYCR